VIGLSLAKARTALRHAQCQAPDVNRVPAETGTSTLTCGTQGQIGQVFQQRPAAGTAARHGLVHVSYCVRPPQVHLVYAVPTGDTWNPGDKSGIANAIRSLQSWYFDQVGKTFSIANAHQQLCQLPHAASHYLVDTWDKIFNDLQPCAKVTYTGASKDWIVYADVDHTCNTDGPIGEGTDGLTILGVQDLSGLIGGPVSECGESFDFPVGRYIGGLGHELGHTFGLPHPPGCDDGLPTCDENALMWAGYVSYPDTYLRDDEKQMLLKSPYFWRTTATG
jgi:hypothetical protein